MTVWLQHSPFTILLKANKIGKKSTSLHFTLLSLSGKEELHDAVTGIICQHLCVMMFFKNWTILFPIATTTKLIWKVLNTIQNWHFLFPPKSLCNHTSLVTFNCVDLKVHTYYSWVIWWVNLVLRDFENMGYHQKVFARSFCKEKAILCVLRITWDRKLHCNSHKIDVDVKTQ